MAGKGRMLRRMHLPKLTMFLNLAVVGRERRQRRQGTGAGDLEGAVVGREVLLDFVGVVVEDVERLADDIPDHAFGARRLWRTRPHHQREARAFFTVMQRGAQPTQ